MSIWSKKAFCHYTGYWYCSDCMSAEKRSIPWYVQENFDFKAYNVCKRGQEELSLLFSKSNIEIESKSQVVLENKILYRTLVDTVF